MASAEYLKKNYPTLYYGYHTAPPIPPKLVSSALIGLGSIALGAAFKGAKSIAREQLLRRKYGARYIPKNKRKKLAAMKSCAGGSGRCGCLSCKRKHKKMSTK